jgi:hypothetical protein
VTGSGAFVNAARSVLALVRNPDDPEGEQGRERVLAHVASNWGTYAPSLAARVETREIDLDDGSRSDIGYMEITGETDINVDDLQRARDENSGTDIEEAIGAALIGGPRPSRQVKAQVAAELGCSPKTVERAGARMAKREPIELVIARERTVPPTTTWSLPKGDTTSSPKGTPPNTKCVPIGKGTVPIGFSTSNRDKGRASNGAVPFEDGRTVVDLSDEEIQAVFPGSKFEEDAA